MSDDADDPHAAWREWHERRAAAVSAPYGPLTLTGTFWLADYPEGRIPAVPGRWRTTEAGVALTVAAGEPCALDGEPFRGDVVLGADETPPARSRLSAGELRIVVIRREGEWGVRVFDPAAEARRAFDGAEHALRVAVDPDDGSLRAVFGDAAGGDSGYRFRSLKPGIPDARGAIAVDFNRSLLPPCAFSDHLIRPFPPPGNTLPFGVAAGGRRLKAALATGI
ncbi:DUF1684 domain-containing protein [Streptomyces kutzneri]|uniref:DUF1684 domain-containing protein n=1 Tax=Streptomyces kutzneri TaxID=3051179 RepID=UPI0028D49D6C|nr:DUF1684 domain-containing protein [Streptomyces sp. DSM 40907]